MTEEQEYYWDEDSQTYYYWDEETQAYYPWVEEEQATGGDSTSGGELEYLTQVAPGISDTEHPSSPDSVSPQGTEHYTRGGQRGFTRHLSLAEHGGLEGCLQIINEERQQRQRAGTVRLTDEDIKVAQQKARVRDMLSQSGLGDQDLIKRAEEEDLRGDGIVTPPEPEQPLSALDTLKRQSIAEVRSDLFRNTARATGENGQYRRRSTVRFGTSEFNDPSFQTKIEAMLSSSVKK